MQTVINRARYIIRPQKFNSVSRMYSAVNDAPEIEFKKVNQIGSITLNRPKQLNALNLSMAKQLYKQLSEYEADNDIKAVVIKGAGDAAFCAGGDVKKIRQDVLDNKIDLALEFFHEEYKLNYRISTYSKPYIALLNGVTMGGGVGLSIHGKYRVATEKTLFAMPETAIGFFADVGASYFMSRLKNSFGMYLVLTGNRVKGKDNKRLGIATHFVGQNDLTNLENQLVAATDLNAERVASILNGFSVPIDDEFDNSKKIADIFSAPSLEEIYGRLENDGTDWSKQQIALLNKMCPTSLKVAVRQLNEGSKMDLLDNFKMEYMLGQRFIVDGNFCEGVRALLVDRGSKPVWKPATYSEVNSQKVDWFFTPRPEDKHFDLNAKL